MGPVALTSGTTTATGGQEISLDVFAKNVADGSDEARLALAQQLKDAGLWKGNISSRFDIKYYGALVKLEEQYQGQIALNKLLGVPTATTRYDSLASLLADGDGGASKTRVSKSTRLSDATTAEALVTAVMQDQVGRGPSTAELKKYTQALQKAQAAAPTTTVTTGAPATSTSQTTGGINEQQFLINEIAGTDEAQAQKVKSFYDVFKQAIGVS